MKHIWVSSWTKTNREYERNGWKWYLCIITIWLALLRQYLVGLVIHIIRMATSMPIYLLGEFGISALHGATRILFYISFNMKLNRRKNDKWKKKLNKKTECSTQKYYCVRFCFVLSLVPCKFSDFRQIQFHWMNTAAKIESTFYIRINKTERPMKLHKM